MRREISRQYLMSIITCVFPQNCLQADCELAMRLEDIFSFHSCPPGESDPISMRNFLVKVVQLTGDLGAISFHNIGKDIFHSDYLFQIHSQKIPKKQDTFYSKYFSIFKTEP